MKKMGEEQSVPSDHSVNRLSAWDAISCINTPQTASPQHFQNKSPPIYDYQSTRQ